MSKRGENIQQKCKYNRFRTLYALENKSCNICKKNNVERSKNLVVLEERRQVESQRRQRHRVARSNKTIVEHE